jgi:hypothetical protein
MGFTHRTGSHREKFRVPDQPVRAESRNQGPESSFLSPVRLISS